MEAQNGVRDFLPRCARLSAVLLLRAACEQEGRAGRRVPSKWQAGVNYAFGSDQDGHTFEFSVGEEVVVKRGDATLRFARVEAQAGNEMVLVLGPERQSNNNKKDGKDVLPFTLVAREKVGKIVADDWVWEDDLREAVDVAPLSKAGWWKYAWGSEDSNQSTSSVLASPLPSSAVTARSRILWQQGLQSVCRSCACLPFESACLRSARESSCPFAHPSCFRSMLLLCSG